MSEFDKLHEHLKECVDSDNDSFIGITEDGIEFNMFEWAFSLSLNAKKEVESIISDRQNAISLMSKSWQHDSENQDDLMTRYVTMAENQFKKKGEEIVRLTAIATKHAARCDELYEALEGMIGIWKLICNANGWDENHLIQAESAKEVLDKSRTEADK